jgi:NAD-dependent dihydropyrimidine dehydrogenase PreA subunit
MKELVYISGVATLKLDESLCNGCGMCVMVCPHEVFALNGRKAQIINKDKCMECGACEMNCASKAVSVNSGVGCAAGIINGILRNTEPDCSCSCSSEKSSCC